MHSSFSRLPLHALRAFEAAGRLESFKAAAAELGVTPAAVSQQVKLLESHLGTPMFDRLHRRLRLTAVGERLGKTLQTAFAQIDETLATLSSDGLTVGPATLTISAAPSFATKWLARRLHRFQQAHAAIEIRLRADEAVSDPGSDRQLDVALRYGPGPYSHHLVAQKLWPHSELRAVCAPELAAGLREPRDLLSQSLLRTASPSGTSDHVAAGWTCWFTTAGIDAAAVKLALSRAPLMGTTQLALEAAAAGQGVALAPAVLIEDDLRAGRLVEPFALSIESPFSFWLIYRCDRAEESRIRAFANWIVAEASDTASSD